MARSVSATQAKVKFGEILAEVLFGKSHVFIEKQGKEVAVIMAADEFREYLRFKNEEKRFTRHELWEEINKFRESLPPPAPGDPDAVQIIRELRQQDRFK